MQLRYSSNLIPAVDGMQKIASVSWAPNGKKFAVATADRVVHLFDESGKRQDKFQTKPSDKQQKSYLIRAVEFSPDSQKVAVAQSDNIVYIYKIGVEWGDKKSICNKFPMPAAVTCMVWPRDRNNEIVFGLADGKVRAGVLKVNKSNVLYQTDVYVVSIACSRDGQTIISGHIDGTIYSYQLDSQISKKVCTHHSIPYALAYGENIMAAGNDQLVTFYDLSGNFLQRFDYSKDDKVRDFTVAAFNPSGDTVVLGNFNRFYVYNFNSKRGQWEEIACKIIKNYYTVTAVCWKNDGSKLITGNLCGSLDLYEASMKKIRYKGKFEFNYVSPSQVVVLTLATGKKSVVRSNNSQEISKINIYQDRYVVANTYQTVIVGDLETDKTSEILWRGAGNEKYDFSSPNLCMIFNAGQLTLIQYGKNEPLGACRTELMKPNLLSARISEKGAKVIAYLLDLQTIAVNDLEKSTTICQISHDSKIDYMELNAHATKLLYKDKRKQLYLYNLATLTKTTLLPYCSYAKWVPQSQVVVAQNRNNLNVWYSIDNPDKVTIYSIKGDVEDIERKGGKTDVIVMEAGNSIAYSLDEPLIEFGFAIEARDLEKAAAILDGSEMSNQTEANWKTLAKIAVETQNISVAEHCYSALGDISKSRYLRKIMKIIEKYEKETGRNDGISYYKVQAKLAVLEKQFHRAESILLENNEVEEAMDMYQELHKWDESIKIAEKKKHPDVADLKENYFEWLLKTGQEEKAAEVKENQGDYQNAIQLYLRGGLPARAANVVYNYQQSFPQDLLERIAASLAQAGMYERAGEFYEEMQMLQKALDCYIKGNAFKKAVELARKEEPRLVVSLQQRWGNYLVSIKQTESAINHYIQAGAIQKAIQASINSREWNKAIQLLAHQSPQVARPFYKQIAKHYSNVRQYDFAEKYYLKAALPIEAFEMYTKANKWQHALRVAKQNLSESQIVNLYVKQAQKFQQEQKWKEAEKTYLVVEQYDMAIAMYKKCGQYDNMIRLVAKYRTNLLKETHLAVAQKLQKEGNFKSAEQHYIDAGAWRGAVEMYRSQGNWEDAVRCSKHYGTDADTCELAKRWAETLGPETGMKMLLKMNLVDAVIEYLSDRNQFDEAFKMANLNAKHKIRDVHLKYAFKLEDEKRYKEAEDHFVKAGKAQEAINMYMYGGDFHSALQVARQYDPQLVPTILINQSKALIEKREYIKAQTCLINAGKPELAIKMYSDIENYSQAERVARKHAPNLLQEIMNGHNNAGKALSPKEKLDQAKNYDDTRNYSKAIEAYMNITSDDFKEADLLEQLWRRAVQLAMNYEKDKAVKVVRVVSERLCEIGSNDAAGELLEQIGLYQEAVKVYCDGKNWEAAKSCASMVKNKDIHTNIMAYITQKERETNKTNKDPWACIRNGDYNAGCQIFAETGDWKNCLDKAKEKGPELLNRFLNEYIRVTTESGKFYDAVMAYSKYGMQIIPKNYTVYTNLTLQIFVECDPKEIPPLRAALYDFVKLLQGTNEQGSPTLHEFQKYLLVAHLANLKLSYEKRSGCEQLYAKISVSLLRYCQFIRQDKLYYEAGIACQKAKELGMASIFLNRYLDIFELIEDPEGNNNLGDNNEFGVTDIPSPYDVNMPVKNFLGNEERSKIRDWLLQLNTNHKVDHSLPLKSCEKCNTKIFEGSIVCYKCQTKNEVCILTGYPVNSSNGKKCRSCSKWGLKDAWTTYSQHFANCPWCNNPPN